MRFRFIAIVGLLAASASAWATPMTITYTGRGFGSLNGSSFAPSNFTITALADTDDVVTRANGNHFVQHDSTSISIAGLGTFDFITTLETFVNPTSTGAGLSRLPEPDSPGPDLFNGKDPSFAGYDLRSSFSFSGALFLVGWTGDPSIFPPVVTNAGTLIFTTAPTLATLNVVVHTPVSEPWSASIMLLGLAMILGLRRRVARYAKSP